MLMVPRNGGEIARLLAPAGSCWLLLVLEMKGPCSKFVSLESSYIVPIPGLLTVPPLTS